MLKVPRSPDSDAELTKLLHARGQRATPQRLVILRELRRRGRHATADQIRGSVRAELPGTSTPTVYATLELLVDLGLAQRVDAGTGPTLYDPRVDDHQHMVCRRCGRIDDLDYQLDETPIMTAAAAAGFDPTGAELIVTGLCPDCRARA